jgi:hypothetical protein
VKKSVKIVALVLTIIMCISILALAFDDFNLMPIRAKSQEKPQAGASNMDDKRIAGDISNMTGIAIDEILAVRNTGKSWNDVLDELNEGDYQLGNSIAQRRDLLSQSVLGEDELKRLKEEGFSDTQLQQAKLLIERVLFQLQEIVSNESATNIMPAQGNSMDDEEEGLQVYRDIADRIEVKKCLYLMLKLHNEFGSMETALDEYLFSIQAGIDLALYIADRDEYLKLRSEKEQEFGMQELITAAKIESKMLELLSNKNDVRDTDPSNLIDSVAQKSTKDADTIIDDVLPDIPTPQSNGIKPENPAEKIQKEIDLINPMKTGNGGMEQ